MAAAPSTATHRVLQQFSASAAAASAARAAAATLSRGQGLLLRAPGSLARLPVPPEGSLRLASAAPCDSVSSNCAAFTASRLPSAFAALPPSGHSRWGGPLFQDRRFVSRIRINRFTGLVAQKVGIKKTEWQISAEKEFLALRQRGIDKDALVHGFTADDVRKLSPQFRQLLTLRNATSLDISRWRKAQHIRMFQRRPFDTNSPAPRIACLTEKILRLRTHMLHHPKAQMPKIIMNIYIAKRQKAMKALYKSDFMLYKHVCEHLGLRRVRFAIPNPFDNTKNINAMAVDGDQARFLIRQRMYRYRKKPRTLRDPDKGRLIKFTRHPAEQVPFSHGKPKRTPQQVSRAFPYGVRDDRVAGTQPVWNPTAAGKGFWPASHKVIGGPTPK